MKILIDTRQQFGKHTAKHDALKRMGHTLLSVCLPYGDYVNADDFPVYLQGLIEFENMANCGAGYMSEKERAGITGEILKLHPLSIDTKQGMGEIYSNVITGHERFKRECIKADGRLIILDEGGDCDSLENVYRWKNPRIMRYFQNKAYGRKVPRRPPVSSRQIQNVMQTMSEKYFVRWEFCKPDEAAEKIVKLLSKD